MNKKMKLFICLSILLAIAFGSLYCCVNKLYISKNNQSAVVAQNTINSDAKLNKDTKVSLFSKGKIEKEYTLDEIKNKLQIKDDLSKADLVQLLDKEGYAFDSVINDELIDKRDNAAFAPTPFIVSSILNI